jgi:phenylacetate-CoA ligase
MPILVIKMSWIRRAETLNRLWRHPQGGREGIDSFQRIGLQRILTHAYKYVPFYREKFAGFGISAASLREGGGITSIPITTKQELKQVAWDQKTDVRLNADELLKYHTSGSTGVPFKMRRTRWENFLFHFLRWRIMNTYGLKASDRMVRIVREAQGQDGIPTSWRWIQSLGRYRRKRLSILLQPEEIAAALEEERPDVISGYAGFLFLTAKAINQKDIQTVRPKFLVSGAEVLRPKMRESINQAFQAPVYDTYETLEVGPVAAECPESGLYHILDDSVFMEILRDGAPAREGETGEVVVTGLHMFAMPFIRYPLYDIVTVGPRICPCGQPFSTFSSIEGRANDFLTLPSGNKVHAGLIIHELNEFIPRADRYELIQENRNRIVMNIVVSPPLAPEEKHGFITRVQRRLEAGVEFDIQIVDQIELGPGMKYRIKRSLVDSYYND